MSQPEHEAMYLIRQHGAARALRMARADLEHANRGEDPVARWHTQAIFCYVQGYNDALGTNETTRAAVDDMFEKIARHALGIETIKSRNSDRLDFHEVSVHQVALALRAAYEIGRAAEK